MMELIPDALTAFEFYGLIVLSLFTSGLTAALGAGGGSLLIAVMAQIFPVKALIPVHGVIQLGSNTGRAAILTKYINWRMTGAFLVGGLIGAVIGGNIVVSLPVRTLQLILGIFIIVSAWFPKPKGGGAPIIVFGLGGIITTIMTMFVGATGPFITALARSFNLSPEAVVATSAACMTAKHLFKVVVFGVLGFAYAEYIPFIFLMFISGFGGTLIGKRILISIDPKQFKLALNIVLSLLAARLIWKALGG